MQCCDTLEQELNAIVEPKHNEKKRSEIKSHPIIVRIMENDVILPDDPCIAHVGNVFYREILNVVPGYSPSENLPDLRASSEMVIRMLRERKSRFLRACGSQTLNGPDSPDRVFYREWSKDESISMIIQDISRRGEASVNTIRPGQVQGQADEEFAGARASMESTGDHVASMQDEERDPERLAMDIEDGENAATPSSDSSLDPFALECIQRLIAYYKDNSNASNRGEMLKILDAQENPSDRERAIAWSLRQRYVAATIVGNLSVVEFSNKLLRRMTVKRSSKIPRKKNKVAKIDTGKPSIKVRSWSLAERICFMAGLDRLGWGKWKEIAEFHIPTRSSRQIARYASTLKQRVGSTNLELLRPVVLKEEDKAVSRPETKDLDVSTDVCDSIALGNNVLESEEAKLLTKRDEPPHNGVTIKIEEIDDF